MPPLLLVVENDEATRRLLKVIFTRNGFVVDAVSDGDQARGLLQRIPYSAVVLDLMLPVISGFDLLAFLANERPEALNHILVVSSAPQSQLDRVHNDFGTRSLRKPFDIAEITAVVQSLSLDHAGTESLSMEQEFMRRAVVAGAKAGVVIALSRSGTELDLVTDFGYRQEDVDRFFPLACDGQYPLCAAYRLGRSVWLASLNMAAAEYPQLAPVWEANHSHAIAALPLIADGHVFGAVGFSFHDTRSFMEADRRVFEDIATFVARELTASFRGHSATGA